MKKYRIIQAYFGPQGKRLVQLVAGDPRLELVGALVHGADKVGVDAGELADTAPQGVIATNKLEDILALDAEVVLYCGRFINYDDICAMLASGKNVIQCLERGANFKLFPEYSKLEEACKAGNSSFTGAGCNAGYAQDILPLAASAVCREVTQVHTFAGGSLRTSPAQNLEFLKFGCPIEEAKNDPVLPKQLNGAFRSTTDHLAAWFGMDIDETKVEIEWHASIRDLKDIAVPVKEGTLSGIRLFHRAYANGELCVTSQNTWFMDEDDPWIGEDSQKNGWTIALTGKPDIKLVVEVDNPELEWGIDTTVNRMVNAIPIICDAEPGCLSAHESPIPKLWV